MDNYSLEYVKDYFKINYTKDDNMLKIIIEQALSYMCNYTGLTEIQVKSIKEFGYAFLLLVDSMYNQRTIVADPNEINPMLDKILNLNTLWEVF